MTVETKKKRKLPRLIIGGLLMLIIVCVVILSSTERNDTETNTVEPTTRPAPTEKPQVTMYVCGYDRCRESGEYSNMLFETGINVWENHDPDRGMVKRKLSHGDTVTVVGEYRASNGPGGLWYELNTGGWINDLWLIDQKCTASNLDALSFTNCAAGEY